MVFCHKSSAVFFVGVFCFSYVIFHSSQYDLFVNNSKTVDSQSLASEKGVSFILSSFRSISGSADAALPALGDLDLDPDLPDLPDMAS